jgi:peroxin-1
MADLASKTVNLSGADLQALVYNAHLDVVHSSISHSTPVINGNKGKGEGRKYRQIAPPEGEISRADRSEMDSRVSFFTHQFNRADHQMDTILNNQSKQSGSSTEKTKTEYTQVSSLNTFTWSRS